jgi:hypothetical protein
MDSSYDLDITSTSLLRIYSQRTLLYQLLTFVPQFWGFFIGFWWCQVYFMMEDLILVCVMRYRERAWALIDTVFFCLLKA